VAGRPEVASREKDPAAAGMRRFFSLEQRVEKKISALVEVVVVVARLLDAVFEVVVARHLLDAVVVVVAEITNSHPSPSPAPSWGRGLTDPSAPFHVFFFFFKRFFDLNLKAPKNSLPANIHTHRTSTHVLFYNMASEGWVASF